MTVWVIEHRDVKRVEAASDFAVAYSSRFAAEEAIRRDHGSYGPAFFHVREATLAAHDEAKGGRP